MQFRELCGGEKYPAVIELTQLRQKIPKEAVCAIAGLTEPSQAWDRLDELFGNREAVILSTIRKLRGFRSSKSSPCEQVIEVVRAVQKCSTILTSMDALHELHTDRETTASVIDMLPASSQERWFHRRPDSCETPTQRCKSMIEWLEEERKAAVAVHLHNIAKTSQIPSGSGRPLNKPDATHSAQD